jgi:tetratricopeptide (TPR) repeat protein
MVFEIDEIISLYKLGYTKQALSFLSKVVNKRVSKESPKDLLQKIYTLSQETLEKKDYKSSLQLLSTLEDLALKFNDLSRLCDIKNSLSLCYRLSGSISESMSKCLEALELVSQVPELHVKLSALHLNACAIYREDFNDLSNAKLHAKLAYLSARENFNELESSKRTLAVSIYNLGFICDVAGDFKSAQQWYEEALRYCADHWRDQGMIDCIQFKHTSLMAKQRLLTRRGRNEGYIARRSNVNAGRDSAGRRGCVHSQCSRRHKLKLDSSTPVNLNSVSSHEKSTDYSSAPYENVFKIRKGKAKAIPDIFICDDL